MLNIGIFISITHDTIALTTNGTLEFSRYRMADELTANYRHLVAAWSSAQGLKFTCLIAAFIPTILSSPFWILGGSN